MADINVLADYRDSVLVGRVEFERVAGTVQYRRFNAAGTQVETRAATAVEADAHLAFEAGLNRETLTAKAEAALAANATFLALGSPTNAQTLAQVRLLTRENNALIRLALNLLDSVADT